MKSAFLIGQQNIHLLPQAPPSFNYSNFPASSTSLALQYLSPPFIATICTLCKSIFDFMTTYSLVSYERILTRLTNLTHQSEKEEYILSKFTQFFLQQCNFPGIFQAINYFQECLDWWEKLD
eukprot:TRINITY_DN877_c0_g1_i1.p1 TRINITY_DN877_c0_g1~~TRINITY_DN877_c0_g1_i1.p1  ORF type:complete len:122 (-),score=40.04 TRINITY_DN877_c0_g1_i1:53-418(-)